MEGQVLLPQDRFLLAAAARGSLAREEVLQLANHPSFPWRDALRLAVLNHLTSPAWNLLNQHSNALGLDDDTVAKWRSANLAVGYLNIVARKQLVEVADALATADVQPLLYKGLDIAKRFYPDGCLRAFRDLDLIIGLDEVDRADAALRAAGYEFRGSMPLEYYRRFHLHAEYEHSGWPLPVEIHWALDSPYAQDNVGLEPIFRSAVATSEFGPPVLRPSALDALALMAIHLKKHVALSAELPTSEARLKSVIDTGGLVWVLDVVSWMQCEGKRHPEEAVRRRFRELGADASLAVALLLAGDLDASALPEWARTAAKPVSARVSVLCRLAYPDLSSGRSPTVAGRWMRSLLLTPVEGLTFRPIRVLEAMAPSPVISGGLERSRRQRTAHLARVARLGVANLSAITRWKLRRARRRL